MFGWFKKESKEPEPVRVRSTAQQLTWMPETIYDIPAWADRHIIFSSIAWGLHGAFAIIDNKLIPLKRGDTVVYNKNNDSIVVI